MSAVVFKFLQRWRRALGLALLAWCLCGAPSGCAVLENLGLVPRADTTVAVSPALDTAAVLGCVADAVHRLHRERSAWDDRITRLDLAAGVLESGDYPAAERVGLRLRATLDREAGRLHIALKAAGPYYADLGARTELTRVEVRVAACLAAPAA